MHDNVDITRELQETKQLFDSVLLTQGQGSGGGGGKTDDQLLSIAKDIISKVSLLHFNSLVPGRSEYDFKYSKFIRFICMYLQIFSWYRVPTPVGISGKSRELPSVIPDREIVGNSIYFVLNSGKCVRRNFSLN